MQVQKKEYYLTQLGRQVWTEYGRNSVRAARGIQITVFDTLQSRRGGQDPLSTLRSRQETLQAQQLQLLEIMWLKKTQGFGKVPH